MLAATLLMIAAHAGRPTWYWILLPATALLINVYADFRSGPRVRRRR